MAVAEVQVSEFVLEQHRVEALAAEAAVAWQAEELLVAQQVLVLHKLVVVALVGAAALAADIEAQAQHKPVAVALVDAGALAAEAVVADNHPAADSQHCRSFDRRHHHYGHLAFAFHCQ